MLRVFAGADIREAKLARAANADASGCDSAAPPLQDKALPAVGDRFHGTMITLTQAHDREALVDLLHGNVLERCEAAVRLPLPVLCAFYSRSHAMNLRRIARRLCPAFKAHIATVLDHGLSVSSKVLIRVAAKRTEAQQFATWSRLLG